MKITPWRRASWFVATALLLAFWMGILGSLPHDALAGIIPSHGNPSVGDRETDLRQLERFLETEIVRQKLVDFGVPPDEALAKIREMSDQDMHVLAAMTSRIPEGGSDGEALVDAFLIISVLGIVLLVILVILGVLGIGVLAKHLKKKSRTQQTAPPPEPVVKPAK